MSNMMLYGQKNELELQHYPHIEPDLESSRRAMELNQAWIDHYNKHGAKSSLLKVVLRLYGSEFMVQSMGSLTFVIIRLANAIVFSFFLDAFSDPSDQLLQVCLLGVLLFIAVILQSLFQHNGMFLNYRAGVQMKLTFIALIYQKLMRLSTSHASSTGIIVNLISNDVQRFEDLGPYLPYGIITPLEILGSVAFLYYLIGPASLVTFVALFLFMVCQAYFGKQFGIIRRKTVQFRDERVRIISDMLAGMQVVKLYCWANDFVSRIMKERNLEMNTIFLASAYKAINESLYFSSTTLISLFPFVAFYLMGGTFKPTKIFASILVISNLKLSLTKFFAQVISLGSETLVSLARIQEFLMLEEIEQSNYIETLGPEYEASINNTDLLCYIKDCNFGFSTPKLGMTDQTNSKPVEMLFNISLELTRGMLVGVCGGVGSGKSTLALSVLQELESNGVCALRKNVTIRDKTRPLKIAYCSQIPWILAGTIKENILFGSEFHEDWFKYVLNVCELERDVLSFPDGVETTIGERGVLLSGGQRARLCFARAVYSDADLYVLDDPLSAVDAGVGRALFENCIKRCLLSKIPIFDKFRAKPASVLLITHQLQYIQHCEKVVVLIDGKFHSSGSFEDAIVNNPNKDKFVLTMEQFLSKKGLDANFDDSPLTKVVSEVVADDPSSKVVLSPRPKDENKEQQTTVGDVSWDTSGASIFVLVILTIILFAGQILSIFSDYYLSVWSSQSAATQVEMGTTNVAIYTSLVAATVVVSLFRAELFFWVSLRCSRSIFESMLKTVVRCPMHFFDSQPHGRLLNRFSKDINICDEMFPITFYDLVQGTFQLIGTVALAAAFVPYILIILPLLAYLFVRLRRIYVQSSRQIKRLEATTRSPIYSSIPSTIEGLSTVRSYSAQQRIITHFCNLQDINTRTFMSYISTSRWMGVRLDMVASIFLLAILAASITLKHYRAINTSVVGLILTYSIQLLTFLQWTTRQSAEVENQMICTERILEYTKLQPEAPEVTDVQPPDNWPDKGEVQFKELCLQYPGNTKQVLKNISVLIPAGASVGVVGRTGAGKSSLLQVLFRLVEPSAGSITIDGIDIGKIGLKDLRSRISIIPQEPFCFKGTLRSNIDPFGVFSDDQLWSALNAVELKNDVEQLPQKLDSMVTEGGGNWSVGERQLICLARAILRNTKLIVMDEATSSVDLHTDALIQKAIRSTSGLFFGSTVLTIAHRLNTVIDFDKILVLDDGMIVEYGSPQELLGKDSSDPSASFLHMLEEMGEEAKQALMAIAFKEEVQ